MSGKGGVSAQGGLSRSCLAGQEKHREALLWDCAAAACGLLWSSGGGGAVEAGQLTCPPLVRLVVPTGLRLLLPWAHLQVVDKVVKALSSVGIKAPWKVSGRD